MIVVTDTSVILNLCLLGLEEVLPVIFGELLGILIAARRQNLIPHLAPHLDRLQNEARFWFSQSLRIQVLKLAGEIP